MTYVIAVAGKGGVGKSTISALLINALADRSGEIVLAVDADPNSNLGDKLGVNVERTIGELREDLQKRSEEISAGGSKQETVLYQLRLALVEGDRFDLVTMGRSEGQGCYCYINNLLRSYLDSIMDNYPYVVIDNEAGMEHLSRRTCRKMDVLLVISDPSRIGIETAARIKYLAHEMNIEVGKSVLVINRVHGELDERLQQFAGEKGFQNVIIIPHDPEIEDLAIVGAPLISVGKDALINREMKHLIDTLK